MELTAVKERVQSTASGIWAKRPGFLRGRSLWISGGAAAVVAAGFMFSARKTTPSPIARRKWIAARSRAW